MVNRKIEVDKIQPCEKENPAELWYRDFLNLPTVALKLHVSRRTVERLLKEGVLDTVPNTKPVRVYPWIFR